MKLELSIPRSNLKDLIDHLIDDKNDLPDDKICIYLHNELYG